VIEEEVEREEVTRVVSEPAKPKGPPKFGIVSGSYYIAKNEVCEDSNFISERGFGVADGVSGWNDYGFSSHAFSESLMQNSKQVLESFDKEIQDSKAE